MKNTSKNKVAPFRLPTDWLRMFEELKELSHLPKQIFWEDACAYWIGESNEVIEARRLWVIKALKAGKISKPSTLRTWTAAVAA